jgi:DNA-binding response OmpR family regulator
MKVLLIEDNRDIADMVRLCLESENIVCEATGDEKAGLQSIKEDKFDAILLDLAIPEFSGFDIFRALKKDDLLKSNNVLTFSLNYFITIATINLRLVGNSIIWLV